MIVERPRQFSKVGEIEFVLALFVEVFALVEFLALGFNADSRPFPLS